MKRVSIIKKVGYQKKNKQGRKRLYVEIPQEWVLNYNCNMDSMFRITLQEKGL